MVMQYSIVLFTAQLKTNRQSIHIRAAHINTTQTRTVFKKTDRKSGRKKYTALRKFSDKSVPLVCLAKLTIY